MSSREAEKDDGELSAIALTEQACINKHMTVRPSYRPHHDHSSSCTLLQLGIWMESALHTNVAGADIYILACAFSQSYADN